jgi:hypothetical protein
MRPLTDSVPKALLEAGGKPLIVWQIERLARAGLDEIVINHAHLGELIEQRLGPINVELGYNRQEDMWRSNFVIGWNQLGLRGDANRELPGTYLPTGTLGATPPGQLIANPFAPNPFAGKFYVEGQAGYRLQRRVADNYRATLSYALDLRRRSTLAVSRRHRH